MPLVQPADQPVPDRGMWMSVDTQQALRLVVCLTNPSALQGARWESVYTKQALRLVVCLMNPSAMHGARWESAGTNHKRWRASSGENTPDAAPTLDLDRLKQ